jgi:hypothetical protein
VSLDQVKPINMVRSEFVPAMVAKKIDAAVFHADDAYVITHQLKGAKVLSSEYKVFPNWWYGGVSMLDKYGQAHKAVVIRFLTAMMLADRWMNNPANNSALIKLGTKVSGEDEAAVAYAVKFLQTSQTWPDGAGLSPAAVNYTASVLAKYKDIPSQPSYSQIVDPQYANAAAAELVPRADRTPRPVPRPGPGGFGRGRPGPLGPGAAQARGQQPGRAAAFTRPGAAARARRLRLRAGRVAGRCWVGDGDGILITAERPARRSSGRRRLHGKHVSTPEAGRGPGRPAPHPRGRARLRLCSRLRA